MVRIQSILLLIFLSCLSVSAQSYKKLTLDDVFNQDLFQTHTVEGIRWMNDGNFYTLLVEDSTDFTSDIIKYSTSTGQVSEILINGSELFDENGDQLLIDNYTFSKEENKVLISTKAESVYRRSERAYFYICDLKTNTCEPINKNEKQMYASFAPDGEKVAYIVGNNIYLKDLRSNEIQQVTQDGEINKIINGMADWVYEEEFSLTKAYCWSSDSRKLAYIKFNEAEVQEYNLQMWGGLYPYDYRFKYPKAGEKNSIVNVLIYNIENQTTISVDAGKEEDVYIPRIQWLPNDSAVSLTRLTRLQNHIEILHADSRTGASSLAYSEETDTYFDVDKLDDLVYSSDNRSFIVSSEKSGFKHLYRYSYDGSLLQQITTGEWMVDHFVGTDALRGYIYFTSTEVSPLERQVYKIRTDGSGKEKIIDYTGINKVNFSPDFKYFINEHSNTTTPLHVTLHDSDGKLIKTLEQNENLFRNADAYGFSKTEFFNFKNNHGDILNAYMMKPRDFDTKKKYPVLMYVYGGPGSQKVLNEWPGNLWHELLVQNGYLVVCVDNRGTGGRGRTFQHATYKQLGKLELEDQIDGAKYLSGLKYVDKNRIGIWGWSYGGYMSSLGILLGNKYFKTAIAVAPVTHWRFYDTIYTERYLQKPSDNLSGYENYSPINHAEKLNGSFLLVHGTGDDNVHLQHSIFLQDALIRENKQFSMFYYPNRNHGIYGGNTRKHLYAMLTDFILMTL